MKLVYLLLNKRTNLVKVGVTKNVEKRKRTLELQSGCDLILIYKTHDIKRYHIVESSFKYNFQFYKSEGEWFNITPQKAVETLTFIMSNLERIYKDL